MQPHINPMLAAKKAAEKGTCNRKKVGAVIILGETGQPAVEGWNDSVQGDKTCEQTGCLMIEDHCARTIHAEANAIIRALLRGMGLRGTTMYTTVSPCPACTKLAILVGIKKIVYEEPYFVQRIQPWIEKKLIEVHQWTH